MQCLALFPISYGPGGSNSGLTLVIFLVHVALLSFIKLKLLLSDSKIINKLGLCSTKINSQDECMFKGGAIIFFWAHIGLPSHRRAGASICMMV